MKNLLMVVVGLAALGLSRVGAEDKPLNASQERVDLARRIYREKILVGLQRRFDPPSADVVNLDRKEDPLLNEAMAEDLHRWSIRWMEAECDAAPDRAGRVAAGQAHLDRMKSIESGKMARKELAGHPLLKEQDAFAKKSNLGDIVDVDAHQLKTVPEYAHTAGRYVDVTRYFRLEAEALLAREKASR